MPCRCANAPSRIAQVRKRAVRDRCLVAVAHVERVDAAQVQTHRGLRGLVQGEDFQPSEERTWARRRQQRSAPHGSRGGREERRGPGTAMDKAAHTHFNQVGSRPVIRAQGGHVTWQITWGLRPTRPHNRQIAMT